MRSTLRPAAFVLAMSIGGAASADPRGVDARYIVFSIDASGEVRPQFHAVVTLAAARTSRTEEELSAWLRESSTEWEHVAVRLRDLSGQVVFRETADVPRWLRSENALYRDREPGLSAGESLVALTEKAFVVRVPSLAGSRLELLLGSPLERAEGALPGDRPGGRFEFEATPGGSAEQLERAPRRDEGVVREFDLDAVAGDRSLSLAQYQPKTRLLTAPAPTSGNRVDLLVMGDGYTAAQSAQFGSDSAGVLASFFAIPPYSAYSNYFNVETLFTASNQSGADHPPYATTCPITYPPTCCADPLMQTDPLRGTFVDTAFDAAYCSTNTHRQLTVSAVKVLAAAAAAPDWDEILMVVNDSTYGGSGGAFSVVSTHASAVDVARHEFGHTFSRLTDEYTSAYPGFPACSDLGGPSPCEANATDQTSRALLKWAPWVLPATPIPTPDNTAFASVVGLFEGARYKPAGIYRPQRSCLMNTLGVPFCAICSQEFVLRLYRGGWGVPATGIDTIEPGSESPAPGIVSASFPTSRTFSASLLAPVGGPALVVSWTVNGVVVPGATAGSYIFTPPAPGQYQVVLTAGDATPLVQPAMAGSSLVHTRTWTLNVSPLGDLKVTKRDDGSAKDGQSLVYTLVASNAGPDSVTAASVTDTLPPQFVGATWTCNASAGSSCPGTGTGNVNALVDLAVGGSTTFTVTGTVAAGAARQIVNAASVSAPIPFADINPGNNGVSITTPVAHATRFHTVPPCRLVDTRTTDAPALAGATSRTFPVAGRCQIPPTAWAVSVNLTVTQPTQPGHLRVFPAGVPVPFASSLNYAADQTRANNMTLPLNAEGGVSVYCGQGFGTAHFILDVNGYFE